MRAMDVMTTDVVTVSPDTTVQDLAKLFSDRGISGVPVVDVGRVVGIVSEGDLLHRVETGTERRTAKRRSRWFDLWGDRTKEDARDYVRAHSRTVRDIMVRDVISVGPEASLAEVAALMETKGIKRVPVLNDDQLVGIISRANLVRALAAIDRKPDEPRISDKEIRVALLNELNGRGWARVWPQELIVQDGIVHMWVSMIRSDEQREAMRVAAEKIPGVRSVSVHFMMVPMYPYMA